MTEGVKEATLPILGLCLVLMSVQSAFAQAGTRTRRRRITRAEQEIIKLSKDKWRWMAERNVEALDKLFADEAVFVHMGGTMSKSQELEAIKSGQDSIQGGGDPGGLGAVRRHDGDPPE